jgi:branched-chain amino acid transport system substrate-binding protein
MALFISDVEALGLKAAQGVVLAEPFYWDLNEGTRAWSQRFASRYGGKLPTSVHAGVYSAILHYLKTLDGSQSKSGAQVVKRMKAMEVDDPLFGKGSIRQDGRKIHDMFVFEVKKPSESRGAGDYYKLLATVRGSEAFRPLNAGGCALDKM